MPTHSFFSTQRCYVEVLPRCLAAWDALPRAVLQQLDLSHVSWQIFMVVDAVSLLHAVGYAHLDIKSSNLMLRMFSTGDLQHPYLFLAQVIDLSMSDRLGSMVCTATGTRDWRLMDNLPLNPAGEMAVSHQQDKVGLGHAFLDMLLLASAACRSSGPPTVHVLQQLQLQDGAFQRQVLQEVPAYSLLGNVQQLVDCMPLQMQPDSEGALGLLYTVLSAVQAFLQQYPAPEAGQQRPEEDSSASDADSWAEEPAADAHATPGVPQDQQLSALRARLFEQLSGQPGQLMAMYEAMYSAMASTDWHDIAAGKSKLALRQEFSRSACALLLSVADPFHRASHA
jgi:hypothetical protein